MLDDALAFLKDPANRAVLAWLGGGVVAAAAGFWSVIKFFAAKPAIRADAGSVAIGRNNTNNPILSNPRRRKTTANALRHKTIPERPTEKQALLS